ncbi:hypothetical protein [Actinomyces weissii]|nr:hypothetical protein [Actinomyces weissii]
MTQPRTTVTVPTTDDVAVATLAATTHPDAPTQAPPAPPVIHN